MKRSSFIKSLIGLAAAPEIAKSLPVSDPVVESAAKTFYHYDTQSTFVARSSCLFTDLNMVIPDWIPKLIEKYGNDDYFMINEILKGK